VPEANILCAQPDLALGVPGRFPLARCGQCGLLYQNPRVPRDQLELMYPADYPPHARDPDLGRALRARSPAVRQVLVRRLGYAHLAPGAAGIVERARGRLRQGRILKNFPPWIGTRPPRGGRALLRPPRRAGRVRVLILSASYGSGHNEAARSLAVGLVGRGVTVTVVDHFRELVHPLFERVSRGLYVALLRRAPVLWGAGYALGDWLPSDSPLAFGVTRLGATRLAALLDRLAPDAVVTVHATPAAALSVLAAEGRRLPPHTTVVTDFVAHSQWIARGIDRYCVAADEVGHEFVARGIPRERVVVTGVPLRPEFEAAVDPVAARRALGLRADAPVVLVMAGSHGGVGRLPDVVRALGRLPGAVQGVVVAGHDSGLADRLRRLAAGTPVRVLGYVADVRSLMAAADLLVTKAGGMTLAEAMAAELPMLLYGSLPGQERRNERFASRAGVALAARSPRELGRLLERALAEPALLEHLRQGGRRARRPDATRRIVDAVLSARPLHS